MLASRNVFVAEGRRRLAVGANPRFGAHQDAKPRSGGGAIGPALRRRYAAPESRWFVFRGLAPTAKLLGRYAAGRRAYILLRACSVLLVVLLAGSDADRTIAQSPAADWRERLAGMELLLSFQGKGSSMSYDAGVIQRAFKVLPALPEQKVIVAGNSSGSILAVYFSCYGFTQTSVDFVAYCIPRADVSAIRANEKIPAKAAQLLANQPTEVSPLGLREYVAFALGVENWRDAADLDEIARRSRLKPVYPVVVVAANKEVLDNRGEGHVLSSKDYKEFDMGNFAVSWEVDVYEFYRRRPDRFARDNPDLILGDDPYIGKACTCFVDRTMFELLRQIPDEERLCDLRLMTTASDMALAIRASTAEPSYYVPAPETDYSKLYVGGKFGTAGRSKRRSYVGGFIMPLVAQDTRRMLPSIRVMGTGVGRVPLIGRQLVQAWYLIDLQKTADQNAWWTDFEVAMPSETQQQIASRSLTQRQEFERGYQLAGERLTAGRGLPKFVLRPKYAFAAEAAILPAGANLDEIQESPGASDRPVLKTRRGLGPLLRKP